MNWIFLMVMCIKLLLNNLNFIKFVLSVCLVYWLRNIKGGVSKIHLNSNITKRNKMSFWTKLWPEMRLGFTIFHLKWNATPLISNISLLQLAKRVKLFQLWKRWCFFQQKGWCIQSSCRLVPQLMHHLIVKHKNNCSNHLKIYLHVNCEKALCFYMTMQNKCINFWKNLGGEYGVILFIA